MASGKRENEAAGNGLADQKEQVNAAVLHYQNQKLVQQLETQKAEVHVLEDKFKELRDTQISYDSNLMSVNKMWNQFVDDFILLGIRAGLEADYLKTLEHGQLSTDELESSPSEEIFLFRLLRSGNFMEKTLEKELVNYAKDALALRHSKTVDQMKKLLETIDALRARIEQLASALDMNLSSKDSIVRTQDHDVYLKEVVNNVCRAIDILQKKHKGYLEEIETYSDNNSREKSEIKQLSGELEESLAELEESRRKLVILQMQKHGTSPVNSSVVANVVNGSSSPDKPMDNNNNNNYNNKMDWQELKDAVEEAKTLAANRLFELHEAQEDNSILSKQLEDLQGQLKDDNYVISTKLYILLEDRMKHLKTELERYRGLIDSLKTERIQVVPREKEFSTKSESIDNLKLSVSNYEARMAELEHQIERFIAERNEVEFKLEETLQDSGKKDFKDEIGVMASALTKEMELMENQLNRSKEAASETLSLRGQADSLRTLLAQKVDEHKTLFERCLGQDTEIKTLKALIKDLEKEKQELQIVLDLYGQEESRTIGEIKESESRAIKQAEFLRNNVEEHSLELRVKAANEVESACKLRLSAAQAEIADLRIMLDVSEKDVAELREAIRIKDAEGDAYISEIEMIGQAYEDMQTQNQHLLQQVADRDDYNIKLVSDSVKIKQTQGLLVSEKQVLVKQLNQVNRSIEPYKSKVARAEEQMKGYMAQAVKTSSENRHLAINLDKTTLELSNAEKELKWLQLFVGSSEKEYEQNHKKLSELRSKLDRERNERRKLEEELEEVRSEVMELSSENQEATIKKLQDEIKECKAILKCGVCFDRPKEVVITKCFHLFCSACIQRNLEIRHRKCPGCGAPFGQSDVREVKI